jgi:hypothetical protein
MRDRLGEGARRGIRNIRGFVVDGGTIDGIGMMGRREGVWGNGHATLYGEIVVNLWNIGGCILERKNEYERQVEKEEVGTCLEDGDIEGTDGLHEAVVVFEGILANGGWVADTPEDVEAKGNGGGLGRIAVVVLGEIVGSPETGEAREISVEKELGFVAAIALEEHEVYFPEVVFEVMVGKCLAVADAGEEAPAELELVADGEGGDVGTGEATTGSVEVEGEGE